tara:strand:+ start:469 stop:618 length:150 start_codon:yes stop_codon:yes gene_type:complete
MRATAELKEFSLIRSTKSLNADVIDDPAVALGHLGTSDLSPRLQHGRER